MTSIVSIFVRSDGAVDEKGEGTLRDAYINGHSLIECNPGHT